LVLVIIFHSDIKAYIDVIEDEKNAEKSLVVGQPGLIDEINLALTGKPTEM
jgi:hypothetical protein